MPSRLSYLASLVALTMALMLLVADSADDSPACHHTLRGYYSFSSDCGGSLDGIVHFDASVYGTSNTVKMYQSNARITVSSMTQNPQDCTKPPDVTLTLIPDDKEEPQTRYTCTGWKVQGTEEATCTDGSRTCSLSLTYIGTEREDVF